MSSQRRVLNNIIIHQSKVEMQEKYKYKYTQKWKKKKFERERTFFVWKNYA